ncbi:MAG TPA: aminotransferase class I/II-fold pyridoxal phosphate-dependent enzyme [Clostridia bacterium]|nr:aminotransferase class I/II-fold pyridoxal phosphate-dependent enzyme [Clostridia bacterium]
MTWSIKNKIAPIVQAIPPSGIRRYFDLIATTKGIISLGVGEPDFVTPWHIRDEAIYSLERGYTVYTSNAGMPELREEISKYLKRTIGISYEAEGEVLVTVGASEAVDLAIRSLITPGDEALVPEPCYVSYQPCVSLSGGIPVPVETRVENEFKLRAEDLAKKITPKSKVLILSYPNNPTGGIMTYEDYLPIAQLVEEHDLVVISDEIYSELTYVGEHVSFASLPGMKERTIVINGFSKAFAMTGLRIGYAAGPFDVIAAMTKIHQYTMLCAPITAQIGAIEALRHGEEAKANMVSQYDKRRRLIVDGLNTLGLTCFEPRGAFYAFPSVESTGLSAEEFTERLILEAKVAVVPGTAFGSSGAGHIRCSYAASLENITEALERIESFLKKIK